MQPYLLPYIGYFQLIGAVDQFIIYDTIKYTKKGWINRNRILRDGAAVTFTLPIEKGPDSLDIRERRVAESFDPNRLCAQIAQAYRRAPHRGETMALVEAVLHHASGNLFDHLRHGLAQTCTHLGIATPIGVASAIEDGRGPRGQDRVMDLCERLGATTYVNPIGGLSLYDRAAFLERGIALRFLRAQARPYPQSERPFVPWLSIVDVLMFNSPAAVRALLRDGYDLVEKEGSPCLGGASSVAYSIPHASPAVPG